MKRGGHGIRPVGDQRGATSTLEVDALATELSSRLRPGLARVVDPGRADQIVARVAKVLREELAGRCRADSGVRLRAETDVEPEANLSPAIRDALSLADRYAGSDATVLISGESGSGKEWIARRMHARSSRARGAFVAINCAAMPETLIEAELFGWVRGAFTGATSDREGLFESASGGTLLLDEIGETSLALQAKLLRVLQESEVRRVGSTASLKIDVRIMAATNRDLADAVASGSFREDLYYRLRVLPLVVPPLRHRKSEVLPLAREMLAQASVKMGRTFRAFSPAALEALERYDWPGNVRELENAILRACVFSTGDEVGLEDLPSEIAAS